MKRLLFGAIIAFALMLGLSGCATLGQLPTGPDAVANATVLDEKAAVSAELAYQAAALSLRTGLQSGLIKGEAAAKAGKADAAAYAALLGARAAYKAGNATDFSTALAKAREAINALIALVN